jgi:hypothetical protein
MHVRSADPISPRLPLQAGWTAWGASSGRPACCWRRPACAVPQRRPTSRPATCQPLLPPLLSARLSAGGLARPCRGWHTARLAAGMRPALSPLHSAAFVMPQTGHHRRCRLLQLPCRLKFAAWDLPGCRRHRLCIPYAPPLQVPLHPRLHPAGPEPLPDAGGRHGGRLRGLQ